MRKNLFTLSMSTNRIHNIIKHKLFTPKNQSSEILNNKKRVELLCPRKLEAFISTMRECDDERLRRLLYETTPNTLTPPRKTLTKPHISYSETDKPTSNP